MSNRKHSPTSTAAYESIKPARNHFYDIIVEGLTKLKVGGTSHEVAAIMGIQNAQVHKRLSELSRDGIIYNTGITRPSPSGRKCSVWQLVNIPTTTQTVTMTKEQADKIPHTYTDTKQQSLFP